MDWNAFWDIAAWLGYIILVLYWIGVIFVIVGEDREPAVSLAWILFLIVVPVLGLVFYFFLGRNWRAITAKSPKTKAIHDYIITYMTPIYDRNAATVERLNEPNDSAVVDQLQSLIEAVNYAKPLPATSMKILPGGKYKFPALLEDMAKAERFIHLQYFIWYQDQPSRDITDVLLDRLKAGVEVRIMNDYIGNISYKKDHIKELEAAGAIYDSDIKDLGRANYRNHRKFVIIDGDLGYTGGINVGQEYIDGMRDGVQRFPSWRDTHVRYTGQAVAELQKLFAERWYEVRKENLFDEKYFPAPAEPGQEGTILTQMVAHGVSDPWESARRAHMVAIGEADRHAYIQTPYFVPDVGLYDTMVNAALSGVDVQMMMPGPHLDKGFPFWAAESYFKQFLQAGGRILLYQDGFFHSKTLSVDTRGTCRGHPQPRHPRAQAAQGAHALDLRRGYRGRARSDLHGGPRALQGGHARGGSRVDRGSEVPELGSSPRLQSAVVLS